MKIDIFEFIDFMHENFPSGLESFCDKCGEHAEEYNVIRGVVHGVQKVLYYDFRICERCFKEKDFDASLASHLKYLEEFDSETATTLAAMKKADPMYFEQLIED